MAVFYLDTSALTKLYRTEVGAEVRIQLLRGDSPSDGCYISFFVNLELTSAILRLVKGGQLEDDVAGAILTMFERDATALIRVWPLNDEIAETAVSVVERFHLKSGDAINLATALTLKGREPDASLVMVSADRELLEASADAGLQTLNPQAANASQQLSDLRD